MDELTVDYIYIKPYSELMLYKQDYDIKYIPIIYDTVYLLNRSGIKKLSEETCITDLDKFFELPLIKNNENKTTFKIATNIFSNIKHGISLCPEKHINHITFFGTTREIMLIYSLLFSTDQPKLHSNEHMYYGSGNKLFGKKLNISEFENSIMIRDIIE